MNEFRCPNCGPNYPGAICNIETGIDTCVACDAVIEMPEQEEGTISMRNMLMEAVSAKIVKVRGHVEYDEDFIQYVVNNIENVIKELLIPIPLSNEWGIILMGDLIGTYASMDPDGQALQIACTLEMFLKSSTFLNNILEEFDEFISSSE